MELGSAFNNPRPDLKMPERPLRILVGGSWHNKDQLRAVLDALDARWSLGAVVCGFNFSYEVVMFRDETLDDHELETAVRQACIREWQPYRISLRAPTRWSRHNYGRGR